MSDVKWIKIKTDIFNDEKIMYILSKKQGDELVMIWFRILCLAGRSNSSGCLMMSESMPYNADMLASVLNKSKKMVETALNLFEELGMITIDQDRIYISNWEKHQNIEGIERIREQNRERFRRFKEKNKSSSKTNVSNNEESMVDNVSDSAKLTLDNAKLTHTDIDIELEEELEKENNKRKRNNSALSSSDEASEQAVFEMPLNDNSLHPITQSDIDEWQSLYPAVDVIQELRKMKGWCNANPRNRKTKSGVKRFINGWLAREQDKGKRSYTPVQKEAVLPKYYQKQQEEKVEEVLSEEELSELEEKLKARL